jgi:hypothetical protein
MSANKKAGASHSAILVRSINVIIIVSDVTRCHFERSEKSLAYTEEISRRKRFALLEMTNRKT